MKTTPKAVVREAENKWWTSKKVINSLIALAIVLVITGLFLLSKSGTNNQNSQKIVCNNEIMDEAARVYLPGVKHNAKLQKIENKIEKTPNFDKDVNCLHIVLTYYINIAWPEKAKEFLSKLEPVYIKSEGFSVHLGSNAKSIEEFRSDVKQLEKLKKQVEKNSIKAGTPEKEQNRTYDVKPPKGIKRPQGFKD